MNLTNMKVFVVKEGFKLYKEDGTDDYLEVSKGQAVTNMNSIYVVEEDYAFLKEKYGVSR